MYKTIHPCLTTTDNANTLRAEKKMIYSEVWLSESPKNKLLLILALSMKILCRL